MELRRSMHGKAALVISGNNIIKVLIMHGNGPRFEYFQLPEFRKEFNKILDVTVMDALFSFLKVAKRAYRHNPEVITFLWTEIMKNLSECTLAELVSRYNALADMLNMPHRKSFESKSIALGYIESLDSKLKPATAPQVAAEIRSTTNRSKNMTEVNEAGETVAVEKKPRGKGIGVRAKELILEGKTNDEIIATIKAEIEGANPTAATIAWYKNKLRQEGKLPPSARKAKAEVPAGETEGDGEGDGEAEDEDEQQAA